MSAEMILTGHNWDSFYAWLIFTRNFDKICYVSRDKAFQSLRKYKLFTLLCICNKLLVSHKIIGQFDGRRCFNNMNFKSHLSLKWVPSILDCDCRKLISSNYTVCKHDFEYRANLCMFIRLTNIFIIMNHTRIV